MARKKDNSYQIGDGIKIHGNFTDISCVAADPSSVFLRIVVGSADLQFTYPTTTAITKTGVGSYEHAITVESPGEYWYYWRGYGSIEAADYGAFLVNTPPPPFLGS